MNHTLTWRGDHLEILDQTRLPEATEYRRLDDLESVREAICRLRVRGAPAIGIAAAYGLHLGLRTAKPRDRTLFFAELDRAVERLASARPTAVNLRWALEQLRDGLKLESDAQPEALTARLLQAAQTLHEDDRRRCDALAERGQSLIPDPARIVTHCNTGALATGGVGTALGIVLRAHQLGKRVHVYADETRPLLQGARLTMWELQQAGLPSDLICDNMAAVLMRDERIDLVIVGADRIAADGSVANKIGTYGLAVLARHHGIPFYVAAPTSTLDLALASGSEIPIEMRDPDEIRRVFGRTLITLPDAGCWSPAFDVTPPELVTAIVTERGVARAPYRQSLREWGG